ncbi:T9SS type A sorting domain-containing protein [Hymenobacter sp. M29]|uniref:T9SS type A sorting domain-containing protein n=1 Tax=Hymenobacter mellowenesis TaxID=3063995 RepID=A0ABT9AFT8_9BACT|nr:CUB domain-containing protein [Hymenobacter sp. M29]MDO7847836.1 T9SS type A sorting domain-containing protein [Hymenobacter sp. M29]
MKAFFTISKPASWPGLLLGLLLLLSGASRAQAQAYLMNNTAVTTCNGTFYDSGGAGASYGNNENFTKTFSPGTAGGKVRLSFTAFATQGPTGGGTSRDYLEIYDGATTGAALIGRFEGTDDPGVITATTAGGQLTALFVSNNSTTGSGWAATVSCVNTTFYPMSNAAVTTCAGTFTDSNVNGNYANNQDFTKVFSPATAGAAVRLAFSAFDLEVGSTFGGTPYDYLTIYDGPTTGSPQIGRFSGTTSPGTVTATNAAGQLTVVFHSDNSTTGAGWEADISCVPGPIYSMSNTAVTTCAGTFFDSNVNGNYGNNQSFTKVFTPATAGAAVQLAFTSFATEDTYDFLYIYDGPSTSAPLIGQYSGSTSPGTVTASNATGQLTVRFTSDVNTTDTGWEATIACVEPFTFAPTSGSPGASIFITGGQLSTVTDVKFNGTSAFFNYNSATGQIRASVPTGATSGTVQLVRATAATSPTSTASFTVCRTTAAAQNYAAALPLTGPATATAASVNNGSTSACGAASVYFLSATELLLNGGFDTDLSAADWTATQIDFAGGYRAADGNPGGTFVLNDNGAAGTDPAISQLVTGLTVGVPYLLQGDYKNYDGLNPGETQPGFAVEFGGVVQLTRTNPGPIWTHFSVVVTPTAAAQVVRFRSEINGTDVNAAIDNISLRRLDTSLSYACATIGANAVTLVALNPNGDVSTAAATVTVAPPAAAATATTWNGSVSADPQDCANWSYGKVPNATTSATIPSGTPALNLTTGTLTAASITIASGSSLTVAAGATLQVNGDFTNNGTATLPGTVSFAGSAATQTVSGTAATSFATLAVNKASGTVQLARDITVNTALNLNSGTLTTGATVAATGFKVTLGATATIAETDASYVIGAVETIRNLNVAGATTTFGGLGLGLTPSGSALPGSTLVRRVTGSPVTGVQSRQGIGRFFTIAPTLNAGLNVNLAFDYFNHERNGIAAADMTLFRAATPGTTSGWLAQLPSTRSGSTVSRTALSTLAGTFTLGSQAAPLPVELRAFTATAEGSAAVRLAWATATEKNSAFFDVERSLNGEAFAAIGTVAAAGNSSALSSYTLLDRKLPAGALLLYYRLRQVDADGTASYSPVRTVALAAEVRLSLYPNPAHTAATLTGTAPGTVATVYDALGRTVTMATADAAGTAQLLLPTGLASGVYVVRAGSQAVRLTVE